MKKLLVLISILVLFSGCSGEKVYEMAMDFGRYQSNLTLKNVAISEQLNVSYLENDVKSDVTLVLLHGFGANKDNWLAVSNEFDDKYHLIIPDLIGDGESSKTLDINYSIENQTKMLHDFLSKFPNKNIVLVGNSMGGQISLNYAYNYKIHSLILIDSMGLEVENSYVNHLGIKEIEKLYLNVCSIEKMKKLLELTYYKPPYIPNSVLEYLAQEKCKLSKLDRHKYNGLFDAKLNLLDNMSAKSKQVKIPTLVLWGKEDKIISVKNAYAFDKYLSNSKLVIFDELGHMPMLENPELTANSITDFLSNVKYYDK